MVYVEGFEYIDLETNNTYRIYKVSEHGSFALVHCMNKEGTMWIPVMNPVRLDSLTLDLKRRRCIPNTVAGRMLYAKKL